MTERPRQLALAWEHAESYAREDFLVFPENTEAFQLSEAWPNWPSSTQMLIGPRGSGKTHLGAIWARRSGALAVNGADLGGADLVALASGPALWIDDADAVGGAEAEFFHLLNLVREHGAATLIAASRAPDAWGLRTADLLSRLRLAPIVQLQAPDLELLRAVLFKLFSDRQISIDAATVAYIAPRIERSLEAARAVVEALDAEAMSRGRPLTRALAADVLRDPETVIYPRRTKDNLPR